MLRQLPDEFEDIVGNELSQRSAGVHADHDRPIGIQHESGRLQLRRVHGDERSGRGRDLPHIGAVSDRKSQPIARHELRGYRLLVRSHRDDSDTRGGQAS